MLSSALHPWPRANSRGDIGLTHVSASKRGIGCTELSVALNAAINKGCKSTIVLTFHIGKDAQRAGGTNLRM